MIRSIKKRLSAHQVNIRAYSMVFALFVIWMVLSLMTDGMFLSARNLSHLSRQMAIVGIIACGMVLVIVSGNIDLSVGSLLGMLGGFAAITQAYWSWSTPLTISATLLLAVLIGIMHGVLIAYQSIPAFIVTLSGLMAYRGVLIGMTGGRSITPMHPDFLFLGQGYLPNSWGIALAVLCIGVFALFTVRLQAARKKLGFEVESTRKTLVKILVFAVIVGVFTAVMNTFRGIPVPVILLLCVVLILTFVSHKTKFGRRLYAIGGNYEAAQYAGINIKKTIAIVFVINAVLSGIAGLVLTARLNSGTVAAGTMAELDVIAAAVIGGASLAGGIGSVPGAILGALIMASLNNGMSLLNTEAYWQYIVRGIILALAVWFDVTSNKKQS